MTVSKYDYREPLGTLEAAVLDALWRDGVTTPEVHEMVGGPLGLAYTTILTVLQRLHRRVWSPLRAVRG